MNTFRTSSIAAIILGLALLTTLVLPHTIFAQEADTELQATIRAMLLSDPRTAEMTEAQVDAMVIALSGQAEAEGITSADIQWRPEAAAVQGAFTDASADATACGSMPAFLCAINLAFGFVGDALLIPIALGLTSGLLILILGIMLERHHMHVRAMQTTSTL